ncbi:ABC transporter permease [Bradyrhizobium manausense]
MNKKDLSLLVLILVVGAVVAFINPRFLYVGNLSNTLNQVGMFGIFSIAEAFVIIIGGIELSVGSVIALLGVLFIDLIVNHDVNWMLAFTAIIASGLVIGLVHGALVTRMHIQPFVVTLCGLLIYRGAARYYTEDATAGFGFGASFPTLEWLTAGRTNVLGFPLPHSVVALIVVAAVAWVLLHRSVFGRYLYAVGKNEEAARYSGIRSERVMISAYVICGGLTAFAAILFAMYTRSISPAVHGSFYELYAIAAAVLGGCSLRGGEGSIIGVVLGTVLLQVLQNLVNLLGIPSSLNFAVMGAVILIGVLADQYLVQRRQRVSTAKGREAASIATAPLERVKVE